MVNCAGGGLPRATDVPSPAARRIRARPALLAPAQRLHSVSRPVCPLQSHNCDLPAQVQPCAGKRCRHRSLSPKRDSSLHLPTARPIRSIQSSESQIEFLPVPENADTPPPPTQSPIHRKS